MRIVITLILFISLLLTGRAFAFQKGAQTGLGSVNTPHTSGTQASDDDSIALIWEGDPLPDDQQEECRSLRLTIDGGAMIGPCGVANGLVKIATDQPGGWTAIVSRFAPFTTETELGRVVFHGQGQISSPAWERAITTWAQFTHNELASGRVGASARTVASWGLGEASDQPGFCQQLVILSHGYAYSNIIPCAGGPVQSTLGGWLDTVEWDKFDTWLSSYTPLYQENNYFSGLGATQMSEAEVANLADWTADVYNRLRNELTVSQAPGSGCPEAPTDSQLLQNPEHGYCLLYPAGYTVEKPSDEATILVIGSLLNIEDPRLHIEVSEAADRSLEAVGDQLEADYTLPGVEIKRSMVNVAGEEAIVLDNVPGQEITRRVIVIHNDRLYNLMFAPASPDAGEVYERMQALYTMITNSFTFIQPTSAPN